MKALLLFVSAALTSVTALSQATITLPGQTTDISGTVQYVIAGGGQDSHLDVHVNNVSGGEKYWKIERVRIDTPPAGWQDYICWGLVGDPFGGTCYNYSANNPWRTPDPVQHVDGNGMPTSGMLNGESALASLHCTPDATNTGSVTYRYYVLEDGGQYEDSIDVNFTFALGVKEQKAATTLSAYPNPASSQLTIAATGLSDSYTIRVADVLGKVVYEETASSAKKSIDVSDFKNGVYLVTVLERGAPVQTRRVVVKH